MTTDALRAAETAPPDTGIVVAAPFVVKASFLTPREAARIEPEWALLAADATEPNPFFAPSLLIPALAAFADRSVRVAIVRDERGRLIALAPVCPMRGYSRLPVSYLATWMHPHCFFAAPLIRRGREKAALAALFDLAGREGAFLRLRHLAADGPIAAAVREAAHDTGRRVASSARHSRAFLKAGYRTDAELEGALRGKKRKELRRLRARLDDGGAVAFETLSARNQLAGWTEDFLALESAGWKGGAQTALGSTRRGHAFFKAATRRAFEAGLLDCHRLTHGGKPIAMIVNFTAGGAGYSFKIAYDENYARYSPGVMLEIEMMRALESRPGLRFVDSCAAPGHKMIEPLWRRRRVIEALNVSGKGRAQKFLFDILMQLEQAGEKLRRRRKITKRAAAKTAKKKESGNAGF
jgi:CelD/BcsL family acetyltransferase involved in cellulose biosynthesis